MNSLFKITLLCLSAYAIAGCNKGEKSSITARLEDPYEIQGYKLGMSERTLLKLGKISCRNNREKLDADRICSASIFVSEQPALMYFYFFNDSLKKISMSILPRHGQLSEVKKMLSGALETKYGKPSIESALTVIWLHKGETISINSGDERTMTVSLISDKYEAEKARREKTADGKVDM